MAEKEITETVATRYTKATWETIGNSDYGETFQTAGFAAVSFQVAGITTTSPLSYSTMTVKVSNDGTNWATAFDKNGNAVVLNANGLVELRDVAMYTRPYGGGGAATALTVTAYAVKFA